MIHSTEPRPILPGLKRRQSIHRPARSCFYLRDFSIPINKSSRVRALLVLSMTLIFVVALNGLLDIVNMSYNSNNNNNHYTSHRSLRAMSSDIEPEMMMMMYPMGSRTPIGQSQVEEVTPTNDFAKTVPTATVSGANVAPTVDNIP